MTNNKLSGNNKHNKLGKMERKKAQNRLLKRCENQKICSKCNNIEKDDIELRTCTDGERETWHPFHIGKYHNE